MSIKKLSIAWSDRNIIIELVDNPVADWYYSCIRRLQHVDLSFSPRQNPLLMNKISKEDLCISLMGIGWSLNIDIDSSRLGSQQYRNELHEHYLNSQKNNDTDRMWTRFHDTLHMLEDKAAGEIQKSIWFDYSHRAGPLIKPFDRSLLKYATYTGKKGYCYIRPHELGKDLYKYWCDGEHGTLDDFCRIAVPWKFLRPVLGILYDDIPEPEYPVEFLEWLEENIKPWCQYHCIEDWDISELSARIPIGRVINIDELTEQFEGKNYPIRIKAVT